MNMKTSLVLSGWRAILWFVTLIVCISLFIVLSMTIQPNFFIVLSFVVVFAGITYLLSEKDKEDTNDGEM